VLEDWLGDGSVYRPASDGRLVLTAERVGPDILVKGTCSAALEAECSGCLKALELGSDVPFTVLFTARGSGSQADGEADGGGEEQVFFSGPIIELDEVIRDSLVLSLPMAPRCSEECKGLCPSCGADLNAGDCGCAKGASAPTAALGLKR
jgi:uncharacterized protein